MDLNMSILRFLEQMRIPFFNHLFLGITYLGSEIAAVLIVFVIYWCVSKKDGLFMLTNCLLASGVNQIVKLVCHVPRPFVKYEDFELVESARSTTGGFSFPSGHTQTATSLYGSMHTVLKKRGVRVLPVLCFVMIGLVAFSRLYLGAHYPTDVLGGFAVGLVFLLILTPVFRRIDEHPYLISVMFGIGAVIMIVALWAFEFGPGRAVVEDLTTPEALADMLKALGMCAGLALAVTVCEPVERKFVKFETKAVWWAQILKTAIGLAGFGGLMLVMKYPSEALIGQNGFAYIPRLFVPAAFGICVWPLTFRWFPKKKQQS